MKVLIVYDSAYGNTEQIARAIANGLSALGDVRISHVSEITSTELQDKGLLIVGSPTQKGRPTVVIQDLLNNIPRGTLKGVKVASFDTRISLNDRNRVVRKVVDLLGYAASHIARKLKKGGGNAAAHPEGFLVKDTKGPLLEGELERAEKWGKALAGSI